MKAISFEHPNTGGIIDIIFPEQVFAVMYLKEHGCFALIGPANAVVPVVGSREEILEKLKGGIENGRNEATRSYGKVQKRKRG